MDSNIIHFIMTGGTIDSVWDRMQDTISVAQTSSVPDYIKNLKLVDRFEFSEVCMKDSRALTKEDLENILKTIEESEANKFIITHGTYTMPDTAKFLKEKLKRQDVVIILTGSVTPLKGFDFSDAPFNLGFAIAKVQEIGPGIYLSMNGKLFNSEDISRENFFSVFSDKQ